MPSCQLRAAGAPSSPLCRSCSVATLSTDEATRTCFQLAVGSWQVT